MSAVPQVIQTESIPAGALASVAESAPVLVQFLALKGEPVTDQASHERCVLVAKRAFVRLKAIKKSEKSFLDPIKALLKATKDLFEEPKAEWQGVVDERKGEAVAYVGRCERERRRLLAEAAANAAARIADAAAAEEKRKSEAVAALLAGAPVAPVAAVELQTPTEAVAEVERAQAAVTVAPKDMTIVDRWSAEIVDIALVPREYMIVDQSKLNALARATKGPLNIPGVRAVNNPSASMR